MVADLAKHFHWCCMSLKNTPKNSIEYLTRILPGFLPWQLFQLHKEQRILCNLWFIPSKCPFSKSLSFYFQVSSFFACIYMYMHICINSNVSMESKAASGSQGYISEVTLLSVYVCMYPLHTQVQKKQLKSVPTELHITKFRQPQDLRLIMRILALKRQGIQFWSKASIQNSSSIYSKPPTFFAWRTSKPT